MIHDQGTCWLGQRRRGRLGELVQGLGHGTSFQVGEADSVPSGTGQGSLAQVPWHLDGTRGWRAALNIAWGPCLLLGPSLGNSSSQAPAPSAAFIPLPSPPVSDPSHLHMCSYANR